MIELDHKKGFINSLQNVLQEFEIRIYKMRQEDKDIATHATIKLDGKYINQTNMRTVREFFSHQRPVNKYIPEALKTQKKYFEIAERYMDCTIISEDLAKKEFIAKDKQLLDISDNEKQRLQAIVDTQANTIKAQAKQITDLELTITNLTSSLKSSETREKEVTKKVPTVVKTGKKS